MDNWTTKGRGSRKGSPLFPHFPQGTSFISRMVALGKTEEEKRILRLGSLSTLSSIMTNVVGKTSIKPLHPNLYVFIIGPAASGKGMLDVFNDLLMGVQRKYDLRHQKEMKKYLKQMDEMEDKRKRPPKPPKIVFIIPGNNTAAGFLRQMEINNGVGIVIETEADTISMAARREHGDYSDILRRMFQNERVTSFRKTGDDHTVVENPKAAILIAGTPDQLLPLIVNTGNGLFSRIMFFILESSAEIKDMYDGTSDLIDKVHEEAERLAAWKSILDNNPVDFILTFTQRKKLVSELQEYADNVIPNEDSGYISVVKRLGTQTFKIAMILSVLKMLELEKIDRSIVCSDQDFDEALKIVKKFEPYSREIYELIKKKEMISGNSWDILYNKLPAKFTTKQAMKLGQMINQPNKTVERNLTRLVNAGRLVRTGRGNYKKPSEG